MFMRRGLYMGLSYGARASSTPAVPIPSNNQLMGFGDSRTDNGASPAGIGTSPTRHIDRFGAFYCGVPIYEPRLVIADDYTDATYGAAYLGNYGISGQTTTQMVADPRATASAKTYKAAAMHPAANVILLAGVNDYRAGLTTTTTPLANITTLINYFTNPANCGGVQKVVYLIAEHPTGINLTGGAENAMASQAVIDAHKAFSDALLAMDYRQPGGNPYVVAIDTWSLFYDPASGTAKTPYAGWLRDGLHGSNLGAAKVHKYIADQIAHVMTAAGFTDQVTPNLVTTGTSAPILLNGLFTTTTGGTTGNGITMAGGTTLPQSWQLTTSSGFQSGANVDVTASYGTADPVTGARKLTLALANGTGFVSTGGYLTLTQTLNAAALTGKFARGQSGRLAVRCKVSTGSSGIAGMGIRALLSASTASEGWVVTNEPAAAFGGVDCGHLTQGGVFDGGGNEMLLLSPPIRTNAGASSITSLQCFTAIWFNGASFSGTVEISQPTFFLI